MDLSTDYLGLDLPHPLVVGASPLADDLDHVRRLADAGAAAIVLRSLFEEQIAREALAHHRSIYGAVGASGGTPTDVPGLEDCVFDPDRYAAHVEGAKAAAGLPVIASLNGYTHGGWIDYARRIADAGADALELNLYHVPIDPTEAGDEIEERLVDVVRQVKQTARIPVAVKLSPFYTSLPNFAAQLEAAGADGLVLFNRFFEPDVDIEALEVRTHLEMSQPRELLLRLRGLAILSGTVRCSLAVSGGVKSHCDVIKAVMCGAHAVQLVAPLLRGGFEVLAGLITEVRDWLRHHGYQSLRQLRGSMDVGRATDPRAFDRSNYIRLLQTFRID